MTSYQHAIVDGSKIFYREAGSKNPPTILLLHGFPTSSHMFRNLIPALADRYHVVAPDLPGFGFSQTPDRKQFRYTFEHLAKVIDIFTQTIGLERYAIYVFDYGAPVGLRLALAHPDRITEIISQNGNVYEQGLSQAGTRSKSTGRNQLPRIALPCATSSHQRRLNPNTSTVSKTKPWWRRKLTSSTPHCSLGPAMTRSSSTYSSTMQATSPSTRSSRNISARNGRLCSRYGATAIRSFCLQEQKPSSDIPSAEVRFYHTGHFALETHHQEIAGAIKDFLGRTLSTQTRAA